MTQKDTHDRNETELAGYRRQIDDLDNQLIALLKERIGIVSRVGEMKRRTAPGRCPIRPAREAEMIRRVMHEFEGSPFFPAAAAALWRIIIGASTSVESTLSLSVFTPDRDNDFYWMAREYFGPFTPIVKQPHIKRVIGDVIDGKAAVGIVPMLRSSDTTFWWTNMVEQGNDAPKIFARIPFVCNGTPGRDAPSALAIARLTPEASGDDHSLLVLEADHNVSQHRMQNAFAHVKLESSWINIATLSPSTRHHLIELKGFITAEHPAIQALFAVLGSSILHYSFLGSYAVPIILNKNQSPHAHNPSFHATGSGQK